MNKDNQAYSDFKKGVYKGLDIAKYTFTENVANLPFYDSCEDRAEVIKRLEDGFKQLLDRIVLTKKPNCSEDRFNGIYSGFEMSKKLFKEFIKESFPLENT